MLYTASFYKSATFWYLIKALASLKYIITVAFKELFMIHATAHSALNAYSYAWMVCIMFGILVYMPYAAV